MNRRPLILVGGGGHCKSVIEAAESAGMEIRGILDLPNCVGGTILGYPIVGTDEDVPFYITDYDFIVTMGAIKSFQLRNKLIDNILKWGGDGDCQSFYRPHIPLCRAWRRHRSSAPS